MFNVNNLASTFFHQHMRKTCNGLKHPIPRPRYPVRRIDRTLVQTMTRVASGKTPCCLRIAIQGSWSSLSSFAAVFSSRIGV